MTQSPATICKLLTDIYFSGLLSTSGMEASAFLQSKYSNGSAPSIQLLLFNALCGNRPARGRNVAIRKAMNMKAEVGELCQWGSHI